jgi:hypothetical protein
MRRDLPFSYEEMRSLVIRSIGQASQLADLFRAVGALAQKEYPPPAEPSGSYGVRTVYFSGDESGLSPRDKARVNSIFWDLFIEGLVWFWASNREPARASDAPGVGVELRATATGR